MQQQQASKVKQQHLLLQPCPSWVLVPAAARLLAQALPVRCSLLMAAVTGHWQMQM
jgi:hypothetical protein